MATTYKYNAGNRAPHNPKAMDTSGLCMECGRPLGKKSFWFEVNTDWEIIVPNSDMKNSQGCWPIGEMCALKVAPELLIKFKKGE